MFFSVVVVLLLTKALLTDVCHALNVTVTPGPVVTVTERENLTLSCLVSQRKRSSSVLVLRWFFSPPPAPTISPPPSSPSTPPPRHEPPQLLIVKMGIKKTKLYGNYTRRFPQPKFSLNEDLKGEAYGLRIVNVSGVNQGFYTCRVQEIHQHRNTWRSSSNGTSTTQLTVHVTLHDGNHQPAWRLLADVNLCAVLICSLGLVSLLLFTLVLTCQYFHNRQRLNASYLLVKCPESSSGETVTSSSSSSSSSPRPQKKETRQKTDSKITVSAAETPPHTPVKVCVAAQRPQKPRRSKNQLRRTTTPRVSQEESLTYAELELVRPRPEPPAPSGPDPSPPSPDTVYAQILFQEKRL